MSGALEKSLAILEHLAARPEGASLASIATELNQLRSGCHRTLHELIRTGELLKRRQSSPTGGAAIEVAQRDGVSVERAGLPTPEPAGA